MAAIRQTFELSTYLAHRRRSRSCVPATCSRAVGDIELSASGAQRRSEASCRTAIACGVRSAVPVQSLPRRVSVEPVSQDVQHTEQNGDAPRSEGSLNGLLARLEHYDRGERTATALDEPLTPELALVDPDLGRRARAQLPDEEECEQPRRPRVAVAPPVAAPAPSAPQPVRPAPVRTAPGPVRRRSRGKAASRLLFLVILAAGAAFAIMRAEPFNHFFWKSRAGTVAPASGVRATSTPTTAAKHRNGPTAPPTPKTSRPTKPATPAASPSRTFVWPPVADADYYLVVFARGGDKIFRARTSSPRLVLPAHWTFHGTHYNLLPGRYSWVVRPGYGPRARGRYGPATVRAKLVIQRGSVG